MYAIRSSYDWKGGQTFTTVATATNPATRPAHLEADLVVSHRGASSPMSRMPSLAREVWRHHLVLDLAPGETVHVV